MTTIEEQMSNLEKDFGQIKGQLSTMQETLEAVSHTCTEMNVGLYGDKKNAQMGVIERVGVFEARMIVLEGKIAAQDIVANAKKTWWSQAFELLKYGAVLYLVAKGVFGFDSLFGKFL